MHEKQRVREYDRQRDQDPGRQFLHSAAWRKERELYLAEHPLCERCLEKGRIVPSWGVHHRDRNQLNRAEENKEALCFMCHEEEHKDERWGRDECSKDRRATDAG